MSFSTFIKRASFRPGWPRELWLAAGALLIGVGLMPVLIFYAGAALLGRYEGASLRHLYESIYRGLEAGSVASWIVLLGPYGLYVLAKALLAWWRASAKLA
jgi:hypothetical protein